MSTNPYQAIRNFWLLKLLEEYPEGITIQQILEKYQARPPQLGNNVNPSQVSERTIHNWMDEIGENYHVKISCGRGKKTYSIESDDYLDDPYVNSVREWTDMWPQIVQMESRRRPKSVNTRYGEFSLGFMQVCNSMLNGESIAIRYGKKHDTIGFNEPCIFKPYFTKVIEGECYVIGEIRPVSGLWYERIEVYSLDRLLFIEEGEFPIENYTIPYDFTPTDYYNDGIIRKVKYKNKPMVVFLNANNDTADYLREHPIAPTQTEIESNRTFNKNVFMVVVIPNEDFFTQILSFGEELTITDPDFLKRDSEDGENKTIFRYKRYDDDLIGYDYSSLNSLNMMKRRGIGMNKLLQSKYGKYTDAELVAKYLQEEEGAFEMLYKKYNNNVLSYLQNLLCHLKGLDPITKKYHVDNLNSITWERAIKALLDGKYQDSGKFENWLKVIAKTTFLNWCDKRKQEITTISIDESVFQIEDESENPERALISKQKTEIKERLIADLPPRLSRVLELNQKGYSDMEIAEMEGMPVETVRRRYKSAVRAIQDMIF